MCKIIGSRFWLGFLPIGFGLITMCIAFVESFPGLVVARVLLGVFESGILPGLIFAFSRYYRRRGIATRIGWLSSMTSLAGGFGGLLAIGFNAIPKSGILQHWRWAFLLQGIITILIGILTLFILPDGPSATPFLSPEEKCVTRARLEDEQRTRGHDPINLTTIKKALLNIPIQLVALGLICSLCVMNPIALFMVRPFIPPPHKSNT
jgi:MFS family permease